MMTNISSFLAKTNLLSKSILGFGCSIGSATAGALSYYLLFGPNYEKLNNLKKDLENKKNENQLKIKEMEEKIKENRDNNANNFASYYSILKENVKTKSILKCLEKEIETVEESTNWWFSRYWADSNKCK